MKKFMLFTSPIVAMIDVFAITQVTSLLTMPNDIAVAVGVLSMCVLLALNFFYVTFFIKQF